jgi:two-component system phosphate regulon response regulator OmpR
VAKPFDLRELKARLKSVLRRYQRPVQAGAPSGAIEAPPAQTRRVSLGAGVLDLDSRQLFDLQGGEIPLTRMEFELLEVLIERPNRPLSRDQILNVTQNRDWGPFDRSIDIHVARLRRKIEIDPEKPQSIRTVRGVGYMFVANRN